MAGDGTSLTDLYGLFRLATIGGSPGRAPRPVLRKIDPPWPFGTIVENTMGTHTIMVIRDEGDTFVAMQLSGKFVVGGPGRVAPGWPKRSHTVVSTP